MSRSTNPSAYSGASMDLWPGFSPGNSQRDDQEPETTETAIGIDEPSEELSNDTPSINPSSSGDESSSTDDGSIIGGGSVRPRQGDPVTPLQDGTNDGPAGPIRSGTRNDNQETQDEGGLVSSLFDLNLTKPQITLEKFQKFLYRTATRVRHSLLTQDHPQNGEARIPFYSSAIYGQSGSGLTTMLAKKAYDNYQSNRPTIILAHRTHLYHQIAQSIVDFADPAHRQALRDNITLVNSMPQEGAIDPNKQIYIVSTEFLKRYLTDNHNYRTCPTRMMFAQQGNRSLRFNRISDILPLDRIREILIDEVDQYDGTANSGYAKIVSTLLHETSQEADTNPTHLFGTTSTLKDEPDIDESGGFRVLGFNDFFPAHSCKVTPSPQQLTEESRYYKRPSFSSITLDDDVAIEMRNTDAASRLYDARETSINAGLVRMYQNEARENPNKKWHIIANTAEHADQLCMLFNKSGVNAKVATYLGRGSFSELDYDDYHQNGANQRGVKRINDSGTDTDPENQGALNVYRNLSQRVEAALAGNEEDEINALSQELNSYLNQDSLRRLSTTDRNELLEGQDLNRKLRYFDTRTPMRRQTESIQDVVESYENGDCNVLIDIDESSCLHSTKTDKVVVMNLNETPRRLRHYLGEAVRDRSKSGDQTIEYMFLNDNIRANFETFVTGNQARLSRVNINNINGPSRSRTNEALDTDTGVGATAAQEVPYNQRWYEFALRDFVRAAHPNSSFEEGINQLAEDLYLRRMGASEDRSHIRRVILGLEQDQEIFRQFISFNRSGFEEVLGSQGQNLYRRIAAHVPDLTGVLDSNIATDIVSQTYEHLLLSDQLDPHDAWIEKLDRALRFLEFGHTNPQATSSAQDDARRNRFFAEILEKKFGLEYLEDRHAVEHAIKVFMGDLSEPDFWLFGFLVNAVAGTHVSSPAATSSDLFTFADILNDDRFRGLIGNRDILPFEYLQNQITSKYPDGPPQDQSLTRFFTEQLYDDFAFDYGMILESVRSHSAFSNERMISGTVDAQVRDFLEKQYRAKLDSSGINQSKLRPDSRRFDSELGMKTQGVFDRVSQEIIFNQLIAKLWDKTRIARIKDDDFVISMSPQKVKVRPRAKQTLTDLIDLNKVNTRWLLAFDDHVSPGHHRLDIQERAAYIVGSFLIHKHGLDNKLTVAHDDFNQATQERRVEKEEDGQNTVFGFKGFVHKELIPSKVFLKEKLSPEQERQVQVLLGGLEPKDLGVEDRRLLQEFAEFHGLKTNRLKIEFPQYFDMPDLETAKRILSHRFKKLETKNQEWMRVFGDRFLDIATQFVFDRYSHAFENPEILDRIVAALAGDTSQALVLREHQDFAREFIEFANTQGLDLKFEDLVINFREQIGLRTRDELFSLMRQPGVVEWDNKKDSWCPLNYNNANLKGIVPFTQRLAEKLGFSDISELYDLAQISEPTTLYPEAFAQFGTYFDAKISYANDVYQAIKTELPQLVHKNADAIKARNLLSEAYGAQYDSAKVSKFTIPNTQDASTANPAKLEVAISSDGVRFTEKMPNSEFGKKKKTGPAPAKYIDADFREYSLNDSDWQLTNQETDPKLVYYKVYKIAEDLMNKEKDKLDKNWLAQLGIIRRQALAGMQEFLGGSSGAFVDSTDPEALVNFVVAVDSYLRSEVNPYPAVKESFLGDEDAFEARMMLLLGHEAMFKTNCAPQQEDLRKFINFINNPNADINGQPNPMQDLRGLASIDLAEIVKESPKLTGVQTYTELESAMRHNYPGYADIYAAVAQPGQRPETKKYLDFMSKFTATDKDTILGFGLLDDQLNNYRNSFDKLAFGALAQEIFDKDDKHIKELKASLLMKNIYPEVRKDPYMILNQGIAHGPSGSDGIASIVFSENRTQLDLYEEGKSGNPDRLLHYNRADYDQGVWTPHNINHEQNAVRNVVAQIYKAQGSYHLDTFTAKLCDAYDACLSTQQEHDYFIEKVSSLIADFLEQDSIDLFTAAHKAAGRGSAYEQKLADAIASILGFSGPRDIELNNRFIDFARRVEPKFADVRTNPDFKAVFFVVDDKDSLENAEAVVENIKANLSTNQVQDLKNARKASKVLIDQFIDEAKTRLGLTKLTKARVYEALGMPRDFKAYLEKGNKLLPHYLDLQELGVAEASHREAVFSALGKLTQTNYDAVEDKFKANFALKKLFPDLDLKFKTVKCAQDIFSLNFKDALGAPAPYLIQAFLEFDGETLSLCQNIDPAQHGQAKADKYMTGIASVCFDEVTSLWRPRGLEGMSPFARAKKPMMDFLKDVLKTSDLHELERRLVRANPPVDARIALYDYVKDLSGLNDGQMMAMFIADVDIFKHYRPALLSAIREYNPSASEAEINEYLTSQSRAALRSPGSNIVKFACFDQIVKEVFPDFLYSLFGEGLGIPHPQYGNLTMSSNFVQVSGPGKTILHKYNFDKQVWENAEKYYEAILSGFRALGINTTTLNQDFVEYFDEATSIKYMLDTGVADMDSERLVLKVRYVLDFLEKKHPEIYQADDRVIHETARALFGDTNSPRFSKELFTEFIDFMSERFPEFANARAKFPELVLHTLGAPIKIQIPETKISKFKKAATGLYTTQEIKDLYKNASSAQEVLSTVIEKVNSEKNLQVKLEDLKTDLNIFDDHIDHFADALMLLQASLNTTVADVDAQQVSSMQLSLGEAANDPSKLAQFVPDLQAQQVLHKLFPEVFFDFQQTGASHHIIAISQDPKTKDKDIFFKLEFDGRNLSLHRLDQRDSKVKYILTAQYNEATNTWSLVNPNDRYT